MSAFLSWIQSQLFFGSLRDTSLLVVVVTTSYNLSAVGSNEMFSTLKIQWGRLSRWTIATILQSHLSLRLFAKAAVCENVAWGERKGGSRNEDVIITMIIRYNFNQSLLSRCGIREGFVTPKTESWAQVCNHADLVVSSLAGGCRTSLEGKLPPGKPFNIDAKWRIRYSIYDQLIGKVLPSEKHGHSVTMCLPFRKLVKAQTLVHPETWFTSYSCTYGDHTLYPTSNMGLRLTGLQRWQVSEFEFHDW